MYLILNSISSNLPLNYLSISNYFYSSRVRSALSLITDNFGLGAGFFFLKLFDIAVIVDGSFDVPSPNIEAVPANEFEP